MPAPWEDRPSSLVSLYDMLQFNAHQFFNIAKLLEIILKHLAQMMPTHILLTYA